MNAIVFDIETQNTFADVANDFKKLRISVVSVYRYATNEYASFTEDELVKLWPILEKTDRLIGFNSLHFDLPIIHNYYPGDLTKIPHLDIMTHIKDSLGFRLKLADVAEATLDNITKSADGLTALRWWQEGRVDEVKRYCEQDVRVTKELYEFGKTNRQLFYKSLKGEVLPFAVNFDAPKVSAAATGSNINLTLPF